jgi:hypothetical protein
VLKELFIYLSHAKTIRDGLVIMYGNLNEIHSPKTYIASWEVVVLRTENENLSLKTYTLK